MEEIKLSAKAKRQIAGLEKTNERLLADGLELEARAKVLEELIRREKNLLRREQEIFAEIDAERQALDAEYQRIHVVSPLSA